MRSLRNGSDSRERKVTADNLYCWIESKFVAGHGEERKVTGAEPTDLRAELRERYGLHRERCAGLGPGLLTCGEMRSEYWPATACQFTVQNEFADTCLNPLGCPSLPSSVLCFRR